MQRTHFRAEAAARLSFNPQQEDERMLRSIFLNDLICVIDGSITNDHPAVGQPSLRQNRLNRPLNIRLFVVRGSYQNVAQATSVVHI